MDSVHLLTAVIIIISRKKGIIMRINFCFIGAKSVSKFLDNVGGKFVNIKTKKFLKAMKNHSWELVAGSSGTMRIICNGESVSRNQVKKHLGI